MENPEKPIELLLETLEKTPKNYFRPHPNKMSSSA